MERAVAIFISILVVTMPISFAYQLKTTETDPLEPIISALLEIQNKVTGFAITKPSTNLNIQEVTKTIQEAQARVHTSIQSAPSESYNYVYLGSSMIGRINSSGSDIYFHSDHLGSTQIVTDSNGNKVSESSYEPFGRDQYSHSSIPNNDIKFTGKEKDSSNLYYYGARYYDPEFGRFTQIDPMPSGESPYTYVENNPINKVDPSGKRSKKPSSPTPELTSEDYRMEFEEANDYRAVKTAKAWQRYFDANTELGRIEQDMAKETNPEAKSKLELKHKEALTNRDKKLEEYKKLDKKIVREINMKKGLGRSAGEHIYKSHIFMQKMVMVLQIYNEVMQEPETDRHKKMTHLFVKSSAATVGSEIGIAAGAGLGAFLKISTIPGALPVCEIIGCIGGGGIGWAVGETLLLPPETNPTPYYKKWKELGIRDFSSAMPDQVRK